MNLRSRLVVALAASVVTAGVVAGVGWAAGSPLVTTKVIHACVSPFNGDMHLRIAGKCPSTDYNVPLNWNAQGPKGDTGAPGAPGTPGPSDAYSASGDTSGSLGSTSSTATTISSLSVPDGAYIVNASSSFFDDANATGSTKVVCGIYINDALANHLEYAPVVLTTNAAFPAGSLAETAAASAATGGTNTIAYKC